MFLHLLERLIQRWTLHTTQTLTVASDQVSGAKAHRLTSSITLLGLVSEAQIDLLIIVQTLMPMLHMALIQMMHLRRL